MKSGNDLLKSVQTKRLIQETKMSSPSNLRKRKTRTVSTSADTANHPYTNGVSSEKKIATVKEIPAYGIRICHKARRSLFSSASGFDHYRGFLNLCVVLLAISNARVFLENILKYGILVDPVAWLQTVLHNPYEWPNLLLIVGSNVFILAAFNIERLLAKSHISVRTGICLHFLNLFVLIVLPPIRILQLKPTPIGSLMSCSVYVVVFLKLWSYAQANKWYREDYLKSMSQRRLKRTMSMPASTFKASIAKAQTIEVKYPYNLSYRNLYYFMACPTLCYEINYPRNPTIDKVSLGKRMIEILFLFQLELALVQQWIVPVLDKAIVRIQNYEGYNVMERLLRLSIPNHFIWLIFFYLFFHSILNALAELLRFADREFYRDWWNAETIVYFWQAWNIPVHKWCVRHVYKPLLLVGSSKFMAQVAVFLLSAFFHEYLVSIPLHMFRIWAFMGMTMQMPFSIVTEWISKRVSGNLGNMFVWMSLILGQPIAILAYVYHYYVMHHQPLAASQ